MVLEIRTHQAENNKLREDVEELGRLMKLHRMSTLPSKLVEEDDALFEQVRACAIPLPPSEYCAMAGSVALGEVTNFTLLDGCKLQATCRTAGQDETSDHILSSQHG